MIYNGGAQSTKRRIFLLTRTFLFDRVDAAAANRSSPIVPVVQNGETNSSPSNAEWSSAVGHAMTGKSGRVIHNLQEDIARLTRECSLQRSRAEEAQRSNEALKIQLQNVTDRLRNYEQSHETMQNSIARKDRKIEDLKAEVQSEKDRRLRAEEDAHRTTQMAANERDEHHRAFTEAHEMAGLARNQYDTLAKARSKEHDDYQARFTGIRKEITELCNRETDRQNQLTRFDVIIEQKNREIEAERDRTEKMSHLFEQYKEESERGLRELVQRGYANDAAIDQVVTQAKEVTGRMKWVMRLKEEYGGAE